ncbi:MAG: hypothetical protein HC906_19625 [Bacteroidales bacterium]|nr:hypothetical protein [Bacteroidales bacterium]
MDRIAESYVKLILKAGQYDVDYVDSYYGPEEWKPSDIKNDQTAFPSDTFTSAIDLLISDFKTIDTTGFNDIWSLRYKSLEKHLIAVKGKIKLLSGDEMSFDEESKFLYDDIAPKKDLDSLKKELQNIASNFRFEGDIISELLKLKSQFKVPEENLEKIVLEIVRE